MNCFGPESRGKTAKTKIRTTKDDVTHGVVVRQHADDNVAVKELADICCGF
jgi:hypothetical protein